MTGDHSNSDNRGCVSHLDGWMFDPFVLFVTNAGHGWHMVEGVQTLGQSVEGIETPFKHLCEDLGDERYCVLAVCRDDRKRN